jgi:predicted dehydrogenase
VKRLRVSIVGLGMALDAHARSLIDLKDAIEVVVAAARFPAGTEECARRYGFPVTTDIDHALTGEDIDAVLLLTPANTHLDLGGRALAAGKHLLVEKPLDVTLARAEELVGLAERHGRILGVVLQHRFRKASIRAREIVAVGLLGDVQSANVAVPWWRSQEYYDEPGRGTIARDGGGVLMTQAIHSIDLFRSLVGVRSVDAAAMRTTALHRMEAEDWAAALLTLGNGAPGTLSGTTAHFPQRPEEIDIIGSRGSLTIRGHTLEVHFIDGDHEALNPDAGGDAEPRYAAHRALIADFVDAVANDRPPKASGREALATQAVISDLMRLALGRDGQGPT